MFENYDFNKIDSFDTLIKTISVLDDERQKIEFIAEYFNTCVAYNYEQIFWGYLTNGIKEIENLNIELNEDNFFYKRYFQHKPNSNTKIVLRTSNIINGENSIYSSIQQLRNNYNMTSATEIQQYYHSAMKIIIESLSKHTSNEHIINMWKKLFIESIFKHCCNDSFYDKNTNSIAIIDITYRIINCNQNLNKFFPNIEENGLLKKGVCKQYSMFIKLILDTIGIENYQIEGISELKHAWNVAKINGQIVFIDLTREIFIRDNYGEIPPEQKGKWKFCSIQDMFSMQPTREIRKVGDIELNPDQYITKDNCTNPETIKLLESLFQQNEIKKTY